MKDTQVVKFLRFIGRCAMTLGGLCLLIIGFIVGRVFLASNETILSTYFVDLVYDEYQDSAVAELITAPGVKIRVSILCGKSIQSHWRSDDLQFVVEDPATARQLERIDLSRDDEWGEALKSEELGEDILIIFEWAAVEDVQVGSRLSGVFSGNIEYPTPEGGNNYRNQFRQLELPIEIIIVSEAELVESFQLYLLNVAKTVSFITIPLLLIGALSLFLTRRR